MLLLIMWYDALLSVYISIILFGSLITTLPLMVFVLHVFWKEREERGVVCVSCADYYLPQSVSWKVRKVCFFVCFLSF